MKTAFVTGGAGFIGSHLTEKLLDKGWKVRILIRRGFVHETYSDVVYEDIVKMLKEKGAEIYYGDIRNVETFKDALKGVDIMFHVAGIAYPYYNMPDDIYFDINTKATKRLALACEENNIKKFVYFSSIEAAGPSLDRKPLTERSSRHPTDAYGKSKKASEDFLLEFNKKSKMEVTIVRPPMTYGERSPLLSRVFQFIKMGFFPRFGKKDAFFEFCYVKNLVHGVYLIAVRKETSGEVYFISEESYRVINTMKLVADQLGKEILIIPIPKSIAYLIGFAMEMLNKILPFWPFRGKETGSPLFSRKTVDWVTNDEYICSIDKIKKLGYKPICSREEGIQRTLAWYIRKGIL